LQPASLKHTLIGFPFISDQKEVTLLESGFKDNYSEHKRILNPDELVQIALFDLWLGNDDRNWNNYNLLIESKSDGYHFIPIDHETIFNGNSLDYGQSIQTEQDSLIYTPLFESVITKKLIKSILQESKTVRKDFYLCIANCKNELDRILEEIPHDWNISIDIKRKLILKNIFSSEWQDEGISHFSHLLKTFAMKTYYSIIFASVNSIISERLSIGLLMVADNRVWFRYSMIKLSLMKQFFSEEAFQLLKTSLKNIEVTSNSISTNIQTTENKSVNFVAEQEHAYSIDYLRYLSRYCNSTLIFNEPVKIDIEASDELFRHLYDEFIFVETEEMKTSSTV